MMNSDLHATRDSTQTDTATLSSRLFGFSKDRLLWSLLAVSMLPLAFMGYATYSSAAKAIEAQSLRKLQTVNKITAKAPAKKAAAKATEEKEAAPKKVAAKKPAAKKATTAKKPAAKKPATKKAAPKKPAAKKADK